MAGAELDEVLAQAYGLLGEGVRDAASPWRFVTLATAVPSMRTVVLRAFDPSGRVLAMHTDRRSAKCAELRAAPRAALHGWDPARRVQLRLSGNAVVEAHGAAADAAWAGLTAHGRSTYDVVPGPGTRLLGPDYVMHDPDANAARAVFALLRLTFDTLEWLSLPAVPGQGAHRRAVFRWPAGGASQDWLVP